MRAWLFLVLIFCSNAQANEWQFIGDSDVGKHYLDRTSIDWEQAKTSFSILTRVTQRDSQEWLLRMQIDCKRDTYSYVNGTKTVKGEVVVKFDSPKAAEKILPDTMPDQLKSEYCEAPSDTREKWEPVGKSTIADVYFDPNTLRYSKEANVFVVETRVVPFDKNEETLSRLSFNCDDRTFNVLRMSRIKDGQAEYLFEKPQPAAATNKTATLDKLADRFCGPRESKTTENTKPMPDKKPVNKAECEKSAQELQLLEKQIKKDAAGDGFRCKQMKSYLKQLDTLNKSVKRNNCAVADLAGYIKAVKSVGCK